MRASSGYLRCLGSCFRGNDDGATEHAAYYALVWASLRHPREGGDPGSANYGVPSGVKIHELRR
jgi:hypothetical protein